MANEFIEYTPQILRARGVAVPVAQVERHERKEGPAPDDPLDDDRPTVVEYTAATDDDGNVLQEDDPRWLKFDMNLIADLEEEFGSQRTFQRDFQERPVTCIRDVFALAFGWEREEAGARMLGSKLETYKSAIGAAWGLAHGADPSPIARALADVTRAETEKLDAVSALVGEGLEQDAEDGSPGSQSSEGGREPAAASTSSGP